MSSCRHTKQPTNQPLTIGDTGSTFPACTWKVFVSGWPCVFRAQAGHVGDAKSPKRFQVPNTEGFLILMWVAIWGMGRLPYIRLTYAYIGEDSFISEMFGDQVFKLIVGVWEVCQHFLLNPGDLSFAYMCHGEWIPGENQSRCLLNWAGSKTHHVDVPGT